MTSDAEDVGNEHLPTLLVAQSDGAIAVSVESPRDQVSPQLQELLKKNESVRPQKTCHESSPSAALFTPHPLPQVATIQLLN